ncbi:MAG: peptidylprolyl isomerase [Maribacter sp.]
MKKVTTLILGCIFILFSGCDREIEPGVLKSDLSKDVELVTDYGRIVFRLSDKTPKHRNNFIKLVNAKKYDSVSFHRVIEHFLIQTGNLDTKYPEYERNEKQPESSYTIDAEPHPALFHKRGATNAARMGDDTNPTQSSSGTQFTIIQGRTYTDSTLAIAEKRINNWLAYNKVLNNPEQKSSRKKLFVLLNKMEDLDGSETILDSVSISVIKDSISGLRNVLDSLTQLELTTMNPYRYPEAHRAVYKTFGGAAHLDQNYTAFGEVVTGMEIVDSIAAVKTDEQDRPIVDVRILKARMIKREFQQ